MGISVMPPSPRLEAAVVAGGGVVVPVEQARGVIWTDPHEPKKLATLLQQHRNLEWVQLPFAGIEPFVEAGVLDDRHRWTCAKGIYGQACAEHVLLLMLAASRRLHEHLRSKTWGPASRDEVRVLGKKVLVLGAGGIARELLPLLAPLKMQVTVVSRSGRALEGAQAARTEALPQLLPSMDFVVLAAPLTDETRHLFNASLLAKMAPHAWLINVARGGLVDTQALLQALKAGTLGGAALDVTEPEPLPDGHPLWDCPNVILTPHIANTRKMGAPELAAMVSRNVRHFLSGEPLEGVVDVQSRY